MPGTGRRFAVVGGGWSGLAAAVEATQRGHAVTLFEMAPHLGGRSRGVAVDGQMLDNGQHIMIGAYLETIRLMRTVGVNVEDAFLRTPLRLVDPDGVGLRLKAGAPAASFAGAVLRHSGWRWGDKVALLATTTRWLLSGFRCDPLQTVAELTARLPMDVREGLIDPLCVAALNTPAREASGAVFLQVLKDSLFAGPGSADLLMPRVSLSDALPVPAAEWLARAGAVLQMSSRVERLQQRDGGWQVDDESFDRVVLATTPVEAARLTHAIAPKWAEAAGALRYEPIVTVYLHCAGTRLPEPMLALRAGPQGPAQFVFDRGQLGGPAGQLAFVISGAQPWVDLGANATCEAVQRQAGLSLARHLAGALEPVKTITEKRATFRCVPGLTRPAAVIAPSLHAAGDHVDGPYPATLEGAVRSAVAAVRMFDSR